MAVHNFGVYNDLPIWVVIGIEEFVDAVGRGEVQQNVSLALVLNSPPVSDIDAIVASIAKLAPTLVHAFGPLSEMAHDAVDASLSRSGLPGILTYWTPELDPPEIIFEFFETDLPAERNLERWSGRLLILDNALSPPVRDAVVSALYNVEATIKSLPE